MIFNVLHDVLVICCEVIVAQETFQLCGPLRRLSIINAYTESVSGRILCRVILFVDKEFMIVGSPVSDVLIGRLDQTFHFFLRHQISPVIDGLTICIYMRIIE